MQGKEPGVVPCSLEGSHPVEGSRAAVEGSRAAVGGSQPVEDSLDLVGGSQPVEDSLAGVVVAGSRAAVEDMPALGVAEGRLEKQKEINHICMVTLNISHALTMQIP